VGASSTSGMVILSESVWVVRACIRGIEIQRYCYVLLTCRMLAMSLLLYRRCCESVQVEVHIVEQHQVLTRSQFSQVLRDEDQV
jgi:hypothetical protein